MLYKTENDGVPYIRNITDIYPIGTLCDVLVNEIVDNGQVFYMVTLIPKMKVEVNPEQNK